MDSVIFFEKINLNKKNTSEKVRDKVLFEIFIVFVFFYLDLFS